VVFRLISLFASAACLAAFVWFGLTVDLGEHTLFGHIRAISGTREAEQLVKGAKSKVTDLVGIEAAKHAERERERAKHGGMDDTKDPPGTAPAGPPQEDLKAEDRAGMRKMIEAKKPVARAPATKPPATRPAPPKGQGRVPPPSAGPNSRPPSKP
jgi:hypothetical protein